MGKDHLYRFMLQPGTRLRVELKAPGESEIVMRFVRTSVTDPLAFQVKQANLAPVTVRRRTIRIENPKTEPMPCLLYLNGQPGYPYALTIERKGK